MSDSHKNIKFSSEHRKHLSEALTGKAKSDDAKNKMRIAKLGNIPSNKGKHQDPLTEIQIQKLRVSLTGRKLSDEHKEAIRQSLRRRLSSAGFEQLLGKEKDVSSNLTGGSRKDFYGTNTHADTSTQTKDLT
jgi:hypothetical protein